MNQNVNGAQPPKKDNTLKILFIIIGSIFGIGILGVIGFVVFTYVIFNNSYNEYEERKNYINENYNSSTSGNTDNNRGEQVVPTPDEDETEITQEYSNIEQLTFKEFKNLIEKKRSFVIVISQTYCGHCIEYKPKFNKVLKKNKITGYDLDLLTLAQSDFEEFNSILTVKGTPTTFVFIDGKVQTKNIEGSASEDELTSFLEQYGFIN